MKKKPISHSPGANASGASSPALSGVGRGGSTAALVLAALILFSGCRGPVPTNRAFHAVWKDYSLLPTHRALAVAGDLGTNRWVVGVAAKLPSVEAASQAALAECKKHRRANRMESACRIYAIDAQRVR